MKHLHIDAQTFAREIVALWQSGESQATKTLCDTKINELLEKYSHSTVYKDCQKIYRKAISLEVGQIEYRYTEEPVSLFAVPKEIAVKVKEQSRDTVEAQFDLLIPITPSIRDSLLSIAVELVKTVPNKGQDYYNKAVGIGILTGRRPYSEVLHHAEFSKIDDYNVQFKGQAKGGESKRIEEYEIPVLGCNSDYIIQAQFEVVNYIISREWYRENLTDKDISGNCKRQLQAAVNVFIDPLFTPLRKSEWAKKEGLLIPPIHPHDLRKIYACLAWGIRNRKRSAFTAYASKILGHNTTNKVSGRTRRDTRTSESYNKFDFVDNELC